MQLINVIYVRAHIITYQYFSDGYGVISVVRSIVKLLVELKRIKYSVVHTFATIIREKNM